MTRVMTVVGTRPEIIRLSRVIDRLDRTLDHILVHTGQNWDPMLSDVFFKELEIRSPERFLGVDTSSLGRVLGGVLVGVEQAIRDYRPDALLVLGDTNSCISALIARRMKVPVYHMEAGNRCFDQNVPEETNRRLVDHVSDFNLVYTEHARRNLLAEGIHPRRILHTGSPMREVLEHFLPNIEASDVIERLDLTPGGYFLVSAHREENVDDPMRLALLLDCLKAVRSEFGLPVLVSTHPRTRQRLGAFAADGIDFHEPFGFFDYVRLQTQARCVLSDSGTISEESAILGFPALTLRDSIERPESLDTGSILMTGLDPDGVVEAVSVVVESELHRITCSPEYQVRDTSSRVANFILSTVRRHHDWGGNPAVYRVLMTSAVFEPGFRGGGPVRSIARIVDTVSDRIGVALVTRDRDHGAPTPYEGLSGRWLRRGGAAVFYLGTGNVRQWLRLFRELRRERFDLLYVNSLFAPMFSILPVLAVRVGLIDADQVLIAPRGELSPGALALKGTKKRLFLRWWGAVLRDMAVVWHASTPMEAGDIRAVCPWAAVEINENQTALPGEPELPSTVNTGPIRLVFISRITPKKNLDLALCALSRVVSPFVFDIYGPVEDERYWAECRSIIRDMPPNARITYHGEVHPDRVRETFANYDAFVFPTRGENFGHVVAESLSVSCPVVCSAETPWTDVLQAGGGTVVRDLSVKGLRTALQRLAAEGPVERARRRVRAGEAYRSWRSATREANILDQVAGESS